MKKNKLILFLVVGLSLVSIGLHAEVKESVFVPESQQIIGHVQAVFDGYEKPKTKNELELTKLSSVDGNCDFHLDFLPSIDLRKSGFITIPVNGHCNSTKVDGYATLNYFESQEKDKIFTSKFSDVFYQDKDSNHSLYLSRYIGHYPVNSEEFNKARSMSDIDHSNRKLAVESCSNKYNYSQEYAKYRSCVESEAEANNATLSSDSGTLFMREIAALSPQISADIDAENKKYQDKCFGIELTVGQVISNADKAISNLSERCSPLTDR